MATIVHAADLHIDGVVPGPADLLGASTADVRAATRRSVTKLVDLTLAEQADLLILAGDVFDRDADSVDAGRFFAGEMDRLQEAGVPVLVAAGNHDVRCPRATAYPQNVRWFGAEVAGSRVFGDLGVAVHGQSLADPTEPADLSAAFPAPLPGYVNIGVLHTSLDGRASRTFCAPSSTAGLAASGYDYWALGHVHRRRVVARAPWLVFPGNLQGRGPGEYGSKGATVLTTQADRVDSVTHRELAVLRWERTWFDTGGEMAGGAYPVEEMLERLREVVPAAGPVERPVLWDVVIAGAGAVPSLEAVRSVAVDRPDLLVRRVGRDASWDRVVGSGHKS